MLDIFNTDISEVIRCKKQITNKNVVISLI